MVSTHYTVLAAALMGAAQATLYPGTTTENHTCVIGKSLNL
jgi:hypothetical protein